MEYKFKTYRFGVNIIDLADFLGIDGMVGPDFKVHGQKKLEWRMKVNDMGYYLGGIDFIVDELDLKLTWSAYTEFMEDRDKMQLAKFPGSTFNDHDYSGSFSVYANVTNGWDLRFENVKIDAGSGYEFEPEEVDIYLTEKVIIVR